MLFRSEAKFRRYMKDFERRNPPTFLGGFDVMIAEDWLHWINCIFTVNELQDDVICINATTFQFIDEAIHWWDITVISNPIEMMKWVELFTLK